jgi:hypothetical protein
MLNRRQRRKFEQKAAKETKVNQGWVSVHGHLVGPSASLQSSSRFKWCSQMRWPMSVRLQIGLVLLRRGCEPLRSMLNGRQRREFEQKAAKETKVNQGFGSPSWSSGRDFGVSSFVLIVFADSPNAVACRRSGAALANDRHGIPIPNAPLFPSLPSVQIFFYSFC